MSGMKFRKTCSVCNTTFFSPDRRALYCLKCVKKRVVKHVPRPPAPVRASSPAPRSAAPAGRPAAAPRKKRIARAPKVDALTSEIRERIIKVYEEEFEEQETLLRDVHAQIANKLWVKRQLVADVLREFHQAQIVITEEQKARAIEMYQRFVESGHRPEGGRRRAISVTLNVPYKQVMKAIREWSVGEYQKSPTPNPSRQQLFEIEKLYWQEIEKQRYRLTELPAKIAEQLEYVTRWQVLRWLDVLHDDERTFANVPDPLPEIQQQILDAYKEYLASPAPPEHGLHYSIAGRIEKVTPRQVHKVLQNHRHQTRATYPMI